MSGLPGYDRWLESGPGGPYDDGEVECSVCDGRGEHESNCDGDLYRCSSCCGTGRVLASDQDDDCNEDELSDAEADADALEGAGLGSES